MKTSVLVTDQTVPSHDHNLIGADSSNRSQPHVVTYLRSRRRRRRVLPLLLDLAQGDSETTQLAQKPRTFISTAKGD